MNMREKIAIAISGAPFPSKASLRKADAVLDILMEPTPEMIEAGRWPAEDDGPLACFRAMIQSAKEGK